MFCGKEKKISELSIPREFNGSGTRLNEDSCFINSKYTQSIGPGSYYLQSFRNNETNKNASDFALSQNIINSRNGCNIEIDNELRLKSGNVITNDKKINQLFSRPFLTVPFMGKGSGNPYVDNLKSEDTYQTRDCNMIKKENNNFVPLVKCIKKSIQNPKHLITEDVDIDWVRGGLPSRQLVRDVEEQSCLN